jgi:hypothetical protein
VFLTGIKKTGSWWPVFFGLVFCGVCVPDGRAEDPGRQACRPNRIGYAEKYLSDRQSNMFCDKSDNGKQSQGERNTDAEWQQRNADCGRRRASHLLS